MTSHHTISPEEDDDLARRVSDYSHQSRYNSTSSTSTAFAPGSSCFENRIRLDFGPQAPFCGRRQELEALVQACTQVEQTKRPASVWIQGSAGCGKSRLVEAFREEMQKMERKQLRSSGHTKHKTSFRDDNDNNAGSDIVASAAIADAFHPQQQQQQQPLDNHPPVVVSPLPSMPQPSTTFNNEQQHQQSAQSKPPNGSSSTSTPPPPPLFCSAKFDQGQAASSEALGPVLDCFNALTNELLLHDEAQAEYWKTMFSLELKKDLVILASLLPGFADLETSSSSLVPPPMPAPMAMNRSHTTTSGQTPPLPIGSAFPGVPSMPAPPPAGIIRSRTVGGPTSTMVPNPLAQSQPAAPLHRLPSLEQRTFAFSQPATSAPRYRSSTVGDQHNDNGDFPQPPYPPPAPNGELSRSKTLGDPDIVPLNRPPSSPRRARSADEDPSLAPLPELPPPSEGFDVDVSSMAEPSPLELPVIQQQQQHSPPMMPSKGSLIGISDQSLLGSLDASEAWKMQPNAQSKGSHISSSSQSLLGSPDASQRLKMQANPQDFPPPPHQDLSPRSSPPPLPPPPGKPMTRSQTQQTSPSPRFPTKPLRAARARTTGENDDDPTTTPATADVAPISTSHQRLMPPTFQLKQMQDMSMRAALLRTTSSRNVLSQRGSSRKDNKKGGSRSKFKQSHSDDGLQGDLDHVQQLRGSSTGTESTTKQKRKQQQQQPQTFVPSHSAEPERNPQQANGSTDKLRPSGAFVSPEQEDYSVERVQFALREYLRCVCKQRMVIFYFDDVQWASREAIHLFRTILMDLSSAPRRFLFLATHRPLPRGHEMLKLVNELTLAADRPPGKVVAPNRKPLRITVGSFTQQDVVQLVSRLLKRDEQDVEPLATLVHRKTDGNCFFAIEFVRLLENKALILYSLVNYRWEWLDLNEIAANTQISDNVVDVVASKICEAPQDIKLALLTAAAFGVARFSAHTLFRAIPGADDMRETLVRRASAEIQIHQAMQSIPSVEALICTLEEACDENYMEALGASHYRFSHDRVREAAVSLLPQGLHLNMLRLRIGRQLRRWLLESQQDGVFDEKLLLQVVIQLNQAADLITDEEEKVGLSELNFLAADNAIQQSSFFPASDFLRTGIDLLGEQPWEDHYDIMMKLSDTLMRMDYCCGRLVVSVELANEILQHAKTFDDKKMAYHIKVLWLAQNDRVDESLELILSVLDELGAPVPRKFLRFHRILEWARTQRMLRGLTDRKLLSLPDATAEHLDDIGSFMERLEEVALNGSNPRPNLLSVALLRVMQLTLKNGRFSMTPTCLVSWGWANARAGKLDAAHRFGELGVRLAKEESGGYHDERAILMYYMHIYHWRVPYHDGIKPTTEALQKLWDLGAIEYVFLDTITYLRIYFCCGLQLEPLALDIRKYVDLLKDYGHRLAFENHVAFFQTVANLIGPSDESEHHLSGEFTIRDDVEEDWDDRSNDLALQQTIFQRMMLAYFFNDIKVALEMSDRMWPPFQEGHDVFLPFRVFFMGMTALSSYNRTRRISQFRKGRKMMRIMERWDKSGVVNVHHMLFLMKAEHNAGFKSMDFFKVRRSFDHAIAKAARRGFLHFQALGNERAGVYCISKGEHEWATLYLVEAKNLYTEWGALAKVQKMSRQYEAYLSGSSSMGGDRRGSTINARTRLSDISREAYKDLRTDNSVGGGSNANNPRSSAGSTIAPTSLQRGSSSWYGGAGGSAPLMPQVSQGGDAYVTE